jgi:hypothetical protein
MLNVNILSKGPQGNDLKELDVPIRGSLNSASLLTSLICEHNSLMVRMMTPDKHLFESLKKELNKWVNQGLIIESTIKRFRKKQLTYSFSTNIKHKDIIAFVDMPLVNYGFDSYFFLFSNPNNIDLELINSRIILDESVKYGKKWINWIKESIELLKCDLAIIPDNDCSVLQIIGYSAQIDIVLKLLIKE